MTVSHLRFSPQPIHSPVPDQPGELRGLPPVRLPGRIDVLEHAEPGATFLLNSPYGPDEVWEQLPVEGPGADHQEAAAVLRRRRHRVASEAGLGPRINTVMQTCFFALANVLPARPGRSPRSRTRSRRPTASAARRCCAGTSPPSTAPWRACTRSTIPATCRRRTAPAAGRARRRARLRPAASRP